jgi:hypothetical protein
VGVVGLIERAGGAVEQKDVSVALVFVGPTQAVGGVVFNGRVDGVGSVCDVALAGVINHIDGNERSGGGVDDDVGHSEVAAGDRGEVVMQVHAGKSGLAGDEGVVWIEGSAGDIGIPDVAGGEGDIAIEAGACAEGHDFATAGCGWRTTGAGFTVSENVADAVRAVGWVESVTVTVTLAVPAEWTAGVPEIVPVAPAMVRPVGRPEAEKA